MGRCGALKPNDGREVFSCLWHQIHGRAQAMYDTLAGVGENGVLPVPRDTGTPLDQWQCCLHARRDRTGIEETQRSLPSLPTWVSQSVWIAKTLRAMISPAQPHSPSPQVLSPNIARCRSASATGNAFQPRSNKMKKKKHDPLVMMIGDGSSRPTTDTHAHRESQIPEDVIQQHPPTHTTIARR